MQANELRFYLALYFAPGIGARRLIALREYFGSAERAMHASKSELERVQGLGASTATAIIEQRSEMLEQAESQILKVVGSQQIITYFDELYPEQLKSIYDPPAVLFTDGDPALLTCDKGIAVIGSRRITDYGKQSVRTLCTDLVQEGVTVISGFARGIDTAAHTATFEAHGKTIAVLGSGVDVIYPTNNKSFARELVTSGLGLLVSELPHGTPPDARNFPWRNRIVSGLAQGVVIVESDEKGGSMITAALALDQNREVFAFPGDTTRPMSSGPNYLIRESRARLARNATDILSDMGWINTGRPKKSEKRGPRTDLSLFENRIVSVLEESGGPLQIDALAERAEIEVQDMLFHLLQLEFKSVIRQLAGKQFMLLN